MIESDSRKTWHRLKKLFRPLMVAQHRTKHSLVIETNPITSKQMRVLEALRIKPSAHCPDVQKPKKL